MNPYGPKQLNRIALDPDPWGWVPWQSAQMCWCVLWGRWNASGTSSQKRWPTCSAPHREWPRWWKGTSTPPRWPSPSRWVSVLQTLGTKAHHQQHVLGSMFRSWLVCSLRLSFRTNGNVSEPSLPVILPLKYTKSHLLVRHLFSNRYGSYSHKRLTSVLCRLPSRRTAEPIPWAWISVSYLTVGG